MQGQDKVGNSIGACEGSSLTDIVASIFVVEKDWKSHESHANPEGEPSQITKQGT
jgi:hypothetical protein